MSHFSPKAGIGARSHPRADTRKRRYGGADVEVRRRVMVCGRRVRRACRKGELMGVAGAGREMYCSGLMLFIITLRALRFHAK